jgi:hypothetical protein
MKKNTKNLEEKLLLNKIAGYSALAGVALLLTPTSARGDIVYVDPADTTVNHLNDIFEIDIDNNGVMDFYFGYSTFTTGSSTYYSLRVQGKTSSNLMLGTYDTNSYFMVSKFDSNINLSYSADNWYNKGYLGWKLITSSTGISYEGQWVPTANEKFMGISFIISDSVYYGWIRASVSNDAGKLSLTIHDWAYENKADSRILTGQRDTPTPIELSHFTALEENGAIRLNWETASETENSGYVIQRKIANGTWENLADFHNDPILEGHGTTSESHSYSWLDESVLPGATYQYRLGDIDHANTTVWHDVIEITVSEEAANIPGEFGLQTAFPNPFNPTLTIRYGLTEDAQTSVRILDLQGKVISTLENKHQKAGNFELQWQATDNASGVYLVEVVSGEKSDLRKVLLTK